MTTPLTNHLLSQQQNAADHFWYRLRARAVNAFIPAGATVLDVGAGAGALGAILERDRPDVTYRFREPDPVLDASLAQRFGAERRTAVGTALPPPTTATLMDVIEHVEDDTALLRDLAAELPDGSTIVVTVPALQLLWSKWDATVGHYRRYNRRQLRKTLRAAGLDVVDVRYFFLELFPVAIARRLFRIDSGEDFPPIGRVLNLVLYTAGVCTQVLGRFTPAGTSLVAAGVVRRT